VGADWWRENQVTRQREEQEAAKPRRALRWAQQAGLQGTDSHQQSRSQSGSRNRPKLSNSTELERRDMPAPASQEAENLSRVTGG